MCFVQSLKISSSNDRELTRVTGVHLPGKTNEDVVLFFSNGKTFNHFPKSINKFFKNVDNIFIKSANITELSKSDLQPFGTQLKAFGFENNILEVIESDLFDENPNLEWIFLENDKIKIVEKGAFDKLEKLTTLGFNNNPCHTGYRSTREGVVELIAAIERNCSENF